MDLQINTERLILTPLSPAYFQSYCVEFTPEVTRYQYPDPFPDLDAAREVLGRFLEDMARGDMLELMILGPEGEFLGSAEVFGLSEEAPELGIWLKSSAHGLGYGREALEGLLGYLDGLGRFKYYIYEADERNLPSIRLAERLPNERGGLERVTTESGRELLLRTYRIYARR